MKKTIFIPIIFLIIMTLSVFGVSVIDSETFDYTVFQDGFNNREDFFIESGNKWSCKEPSEFPNCRKTFGTGKGVANYSIETDGVRTYLRLYALTNAVDNNNGYITRLLWNNDDSNLTTGNRNFSMKYDFKIFAKQFTNIINTDRGFGGIDVGTSASISNQILHEIGRIQDSSEQNWSSIRHTYDSAFLTNKPLENGCEVQSGLWYNVVHHYIFDGNYNLKEIVTYLDGKECLRSDYNNNLEPVLNCQTSGQDCFFKQLRFGAGRVTDIGYDNVYLYEDLYEPIVNVQGLTNCPNNNCLYFDDYGYIEKIDWEIAGYTGNLDAVYSLESHARFNSTADDYPFFSHILESDVYTEIEGFMLIDLNYDITPSEFTETPYTLLYTLKCDDYDIHNLNLAFIRDDSFTSSNESTVLHFYSSDTGQNLGTYTIDNENTVAIRYKYSDIEDRYRITVEQDTLLSSLDFSQSSDFSVPYAIQGCDDFTDIDIRRRDFRENESTDSLIGIEKFWLYGTSQPDADTSVNDSSDNLVDKDWAEATQEAVESAGFRSIGAKLMLLLIFIILGLVILASDIGQEHFKIIAPVFIISCIILGWYVGLIATEILIFLLLIVAGFIAMLITRAFQNRH